MGGGSEEPAEDDDGNSGCSALVKKEQTVSVVHVGGAGTANDKMENFLQNSHSGFIQWIRSFIIPRIPGDALSQRSWRGLDPQVGETPVTTIKQGRDGIAMGYAEEGQNLTMSELNKE